MRTISSIFFVLVLLLVFIAISYLRACGVIAQERRAVRNLSCGLGQHQHTLFWDEIMVHSIHKFIEILSTQVVVVI